MKEHKVLLVTGASSEVGRALIRRVAGEYETIWAHYCRTVEPLEELCREFGKKVVPIQADFLDETSIRAMIGKIVSSGQTPDHIVHLPAMKTFNERFHKRRWEDYQPGIDTSLRSAVLLLHAFIPGMVKQKYGRVVFMLTAYLIGVPPKFQSPYITVKYALYGLMRSLAAEYADKGITVNAVSPEMIETRFLEDIPELVVQQNAGNSPLKRNLTVEDVLPAFAYFLSDEAEAVTGQNFGITGGVR